MSMADAMSRLVAAAEEQWGLVTRAQAVAAGVPRATLARIVAAGLLERVAHGVYRVVGVAGNGELLELRAAWLQLNPQLAAWRRQRVEEGVVSHRSAAQVYELGDLIAEVHEFVVPVRRQTRRGDVRLRVGRVRAGEWELADGLPVTRPQRLVADLLATREDGSAVALIAAQAVRRGLVGRGELADAVDQYAPRFRLVGGGALVEQLLVDADSSGVAK